MLPLVSVSVDTDITSRGLGKETCWQLQAHPVGTSEDCTDHGVAHPLLAKQGIGRFHLTLDRHPFVGSKATHCQGKQGLNLLDSHDFENLLSVCVRVAIGGLDALDGLLARSVGRVVNVTKLAVSLKLALHLV